MPEAVGVAWLNGRPFQRDLLSKMSLLRAMKHDYAISHGNSYADESDLIIGFDGRNVVVRGVSIRSFTLNLSTLLIFFAGP